MSDPGRLVGTSDLLAAEARFDDMKVSWDAEQGSHLVRILPGEYYVTEKEEAISTVLGSCIAACIRCPRLGLGGMNHFMLPLFSEGRAEVWQRMDPQASLRFGNYAMEALINSILARGGARSGLEVKLFGGGKMYEGSADVGGKNARFVLEYVKAEGMNLVSHDLGGEQPRRVVFFPSSGRARLKRLPTMESRRLEEQEREYMRSLGEQPSGGDVELF